jgi:hypothetical protein
VSSERVLISLLQQGLRTHDGEARVLAWPLNFGVEGEGSGRCCRTVGVDGIHTRERGRRGGKEEIKEKEGQHVDLLVP